MSRRIHRPHDYFGTCLETGKRSYTTRKDARKARQAGGHRHGNPYKCRFCGYYHLGHTATHLTRDHYRGMPERGHVHLNSAKNELGISLDALLLALDHLGITPQNSHISATVLHQLKHLTYR